MAGIKGPSQVIAAAALAVSLSGAPTEGVASEDTKCLLENCKKSVENVLAVNEKPEMVNELLATLGARIYPLTKGTLVAGSAMTEKKLSVDDGKGGTFEFKTEKEIDFFHEYNEKLGGGMEYFAFELVKGKDEFTENLLKSGLLDRYKGKMKQKRIDRNWKNIIKVLSQGKDSGLYQELVENSPNLTNYILENYEVLSLNKKFIIPLIAIKDYKTIEEDKKTIEQLSRITGR